MPRTPRVFISGKIYEVCFRIEEGLPLVCTPYMTVILEGILAKAFSAYHCKLLSYVVMSNHIHLHVLVQDPEQLDDAVAYVKRESAHAINNLLGRAQHTVWQAGYDAVLVLDAEKMIDRLCYFFLNPVRAGLVSSIEDYPGMNSWRSILEDKHVLTAGRIPRESIPTLPEAPLSFKAQDRLAATLLERAGEAESVNIDPLSFLEAFPGAYHLDREKVRSEIVHRVKLEESELNSKREQPVIGGHALRLQSMRAKHTPKKFGKKMWVLGSTREIRVKAIGWYKQLFARRKELKESLSLPEFFQQMPPGFFVPGGVILANLVPTFVPV